MVLFMHGKARVRFKIRLGFALVRVRVTTSMHDIVTVRKML